MTELNSLLSRLPHANTTALTKTLSQKKGRFYISQGFQNEAFHFLSNSFVHIYLDLQNFVACKELGLGPLSKSVGKCHELVKYLINPSH